MLLNNYHQINLLEYGSQVNVYCHRPLLPKKAMLEVLHQTTRHKVVLRMGNLLFVNDSLFFHLF